MLLLTASVKLIVEIALMALVGRWLLGLLAGQRREGNFFYQLLQLLTKPFERVVRFISPRVVLDRHIPLATFMLLTALWLGVTAMKIGLCLEQGASACR
ncbi:hypothetical protein [Roseateles sp. LYH14W]|uniref:YggT family protein n=1 Tax=Pelomonas parva TaxID=3299032 RepID=A0ABW7F986_9BURK